MIKVYSYRNLNDLVFWST